MPDLPRQPPSGPTQLMTRIATLETELAALRDDHSALLRQQVEHDGLEEELRLCREQNRLLQLRLEQHEQRLSQQLDDFRQHFDQAPIGYVVISDKGLLEESNQQARHLLGIPEHTVGSSFTLLFDDGERRYLRSFLRRLRQTGHGTARRLTLTSTVLTHRRGSGCHTLHLIGQYGTEADHGGQKRYRIVLIDASAEQQQLAESSLLHSVFQSMHEGLVVTAPDGRIELVNRSFCEITGYRADEVLGKTPAILNSGRQTASFYDNMWQEIRRTGWWSGEIWNRRKNGELYPEWLAISTIYSAEGEINHYVGLFSDITARKHTENQLLRLAHFDSLTGLPNRSLLLDRLHQGLLVAQRQRSALALLFIDLDRFKPVNDGFGHREGDRVLADAAQRIVSCVRESDTVARIGGDEFVVLLNFIATPQDAERIAGKITSILSVPFHTHSHEHHLGASIGIAIYPQDGEDHETILRHADAAMYRAKQGGRNTFRLFSADERLRLARDTQIEQRLYHAMHDDELFVVFQPQVDTISHRLTGLEALVRWRQPDGRIAMPGEFIPVAERSELIGRIDRHVLRCGLQHMASWQAAGLPLVPVSFNLSAQEFMRRHLEDQIHALQAGHAVPTSMVVFEITESSAIQDLELTLSILERLRQAGYKVAIDDFGTGYSSLAYLRDFPASSLKIDYSFVRNLEHSEEDRGLIDTIIQLGHRLGLKVVAEGVETAGQYQYLRQLGCDVIQGFYFSRPLPAQDIMPLLRGEPLRPGVPA